MIKPGSNIALKVPLYKWDETVAFYRDKVGLEVVKRTDDAVAFQFGEIVLWIDRVVRQSQVDVWLELRANDATEALDHLGSPQRDELEPLGDVKGHWTSDPAGVVLLISETDAAS